MLAIRLQRNGRSGYAVYRIVVQEASRHPLSGRVVAELGSYNPHTKTINLNKELVEKYLSNGAQPSTRVAFLIQQEGIKLPKWVKLPAKKESTVRRADKLRKNQPAEPVVEEPVAEAAPAEVEASTESADTPAAETVETTAAPAEPTTPEPTPTEEPTPAPAAE